MHVFFHSGVQSLSTTAWFPWEPPQSHNHPKLEWVGFPNTTGCGPKPKPKTGNVSKAEVTVNNKTLDRRGKFATLTRDTILGSLLTRNKAQRNRSDAFVTLDELFHSKSVGSPWFLWSELEKLPAQICMWIACSHKGSGWVLVFAIGDRNSKGGKTVRETWVQALQYNSPWRHFAQGSSLTENILELWPHL